MEGGSLKNSLVFSVEEKSCLADCKVFKNKHGIWVICKARGIRKFYGFNTLKEVKVEDFP